jgi:hypothetical protein
MTDPVPSKKKFTLTVGGEEYVRSDWVERIETALRGIQSCSTCEACRGAATLALGGAAPEPRADLQAAAFDLIDVLEAALVGAPDTGLRVRPENYLPVMAAITRVKSITDAASSQPPGDGQR